MQTKTPHNLPRDVIDAFINPPVIQELGRIASMNAKERVTIRGEVTRVSNDTHILLHHQRLWFKFSLL